jgi:hypothetical protein
MFGYTPHSIGLIFAKQYLELGGVEERGRPPYQPSITFHRNAELHVSLFLFLFPAYPDIWVQGLFLDTISTSIRHGVCDRQSSIMVRSKGFAVSSL